MRGVPVELPPAAAARLSELQLQRDAALDAANAAAARLNNLPRDASAGQRDALARQRDEQQKLGNGRLPVVLKPDEPMVNGASARRHAGAGAAAGDRV